MFSNVFQIFDKFLVKKNQAHIVAEIVIAQRKRPLSIERLVLLNDVEQSCEIE